MSIHKVAKIAGVSSSTVSRVINHHPRVAPETARLVRQAMRELSYTPSDRRPGPKPANRNKTARSDIAFLVFGASEQSATPGFTSLMRGIAAACDQADIHLRFAHVAGAGEVSQKLIDRGLDGVLLHGAIPGPRIRAQIEHLPTVWLMGNRSRPDWGDQVMPDVFEIGDRCARYLVDRGHRQLAFLNLASNHWVLRICGESFEATAKALDAEVQVLEEVRSTPQRYWQPHDPQAVERLADRFMKVSPRPTGLFVADDIQLAMLQPALQKRGLELGPGASEIIVGTREEPYHIGLDPRPAVVDIRLASIGRHAVQLLGWRMEHLDAPERVTQLIEPCVVSHEAVSRQETEAAVPADVAD